MSVFAFLGGIEAFCNFKVLLWHPCKKCAAAFSKQIKRAALCFDFWPWPFRRIQVNTKISDCGEEENSSGSNWHNFPLSIIYITFIKL